MWKCPFRFSKAEDAYGPCVSLETQILSIKNEYTQVFMGFKN